MENLVKITGQIIAVRENVYTGAKLVMVGENLVTSDGDAYYATMAVGESPTTDFDNSTAGIHLGSGTTGGGEKDSADVNTETTGDGMRMDLQVGYPKTNDTEANNTGQSTDVVTWYYAWTTTEGNDTGINEGAIVDSLTGAATCLTHFDFGSTFDKTGSDTLQVFINHSFLGA